MGQYQICSNEEHEGKCKTTQGNYNCYIGYTTRDHCLSGYIQQSIYQNAFDFIEKSNRVRKDKSHLLTTTNVHRSVTVAELQP